MSDETLLSNSSFLDGLPVGVVVFDVTLHAVLINGWLRERLDPSRLPDELSDFLTFGNSEWQAFLRSASSVRDRVVGDFCLKIGPSECTEVTVSFHRLNPLLSETFVMVISDITAIRVADERLREVLAHVTELSDTAIAQAVELKRINGLLEERVRDRTAELRMANMDSLHMLAVACEAKDRDTGEHVLRVQRYTEMLALELGFSPHQSHEFGYSSILHDVGKVHISDAILAKPGPLTDEERKIINGHPVDGEHILGHNPFFACARRIARGHHENWDGSGYPDALSRNDIGVESRIVHVADVYDALTSHRPYKAAWAHPEALRVITESSGKSFDPEVVSAIVSLASRGALTPNIAAA